jgi:membrane protein required for colicin V production
MNWVDYVFIVIVVFSLLLGLWRGLVQEAISLAALIAAFVVTGLLADDVARWLDPAIESPLGRSVLANILVFASVLILGALVAWLLSEVVRSAGLSGFDRMMGAAFGAMRGLMVLAVLAMVVQLTALSREPALKQSIMLPALQPMAAAIESITPTQWLGWLKPAGPSKNKDSE